MQLQMRLAEAFRAGKDVGAREEGNLPSAWAARLAAARPDRRPDILSDG